MCCTELQNVSEIQQTQLSDFIKMYSYIDAHCKTHSAQNKHNNSMARVTEAACVTN